MDIIYIQVDDILSSTKECLLCRNLLLKRFYSRTSKWGA
jgi:hypothetical protein